MLHIVVSNPPPFEPMPFVFDDGGQAAAGCTWLGWDSGSRAIAIAAGQSFPEVRYAVNKLVIRRLKRKQKKNIPLTTWQMRKKPIRKYLLDLGWTWIPLKATGKSDRVYLRLGELPMGRLIVQLSREFTAVIDGVLHDTYNSSRGGERRVQGYYVKGSKVKA